ncbi:hypothetical protein F1880_008308 [Penicillium rolfsii]|nr:hypothetical protein F1880_008308 [Penicillium rolfsii]
MTQPIDLGHSLLQTTGSPLQLHFNATANFTQVPTGSSLSSTISFSHWKDLQSLWITEAPELELRIFISADPVVQTAGLTFVACVEQGLCNSEVWTNLGFDIILKSRPRLGDSMASRTRCLEFGLCRRSTYDACTSSKSIPSILKTPPEAHIPSNVPTACLASIDLRLRYTSCDAVQKSEAQTVETLEYKSGDRTGCQNESWSMQYTHSTGRIAVAAFALPSTENLLLPFDQPLNPNESRSLNSTRREPKSEDLLLHFSELFNFGLRKLLLSGTTRNYHIKVVGKSNLQNLSLLVPAVFDPEYREAMKQRAASISTISRSLMPMLEHRNNRPPQNKISAILRKPAYRKKYGVACIPEESPPSNNFKSTIESLLWRIAQHQVPKSKTFKTSASFFELKCLSNKSTFQTDEYDLLPAASEQGFDFDSEILLLDSDPGIPPILNHSRVSDKLLSDGSSMLSFQDTHELTQTTRMTQTTEISTENFPRTPECQPCGWDDMDILLSDEILMDEDFELIGDIGDVDIF